MKLKHYLEYGFLRTFIFVINILPVPLILMVCRGIGYIGWVLFPIRLKVAYKNLSTVFPEYSHKKKIRLLRRVYQEFAKTLGLVSILHRKSLRQMISNAKISGLKEVEDGLGEGKGIILTTIHACWFEAYFAWFNHTNLPTSLIYQKQANPLADQYFVRQRDRYGDSLHHVSSYDGMSVFQDALEKNRLLIVSLDQRYSHRGANISFFNRTLRCAKGTAILHFRTKAPVFTSVYYVKNNTLHIDFKKVDLPNYEDINDENIQDILTRSISEYETFIQEYPEQWFSLFHRLWEKKNYPKVQRSIKEVFF